MPGTERDVEALACLGRGDDACVLRLFGDGRAETPRQLAMVVQAQRSLGGAASTCDLVGTLMERFPDSPEAMRYRVFHASSCPH